jgi:hypothetical protein
MATAPLGQPHQLLRSIALAGNTEGPKRDSRRYRRLRSNNRPLPGVRRRRCSADPHVEGASLRFFEPIFYTKRALRAKIVADLI